MTRVNSVVLFVVFVTVVVGNTRITQAQDLALIRTFRECIRRNDSLICVKEKALRLIDDAMVSERPLYVTDYIDIVRNPKFHVNKTDMNILPRELKERNDFLNDMLLKRIDEFFESRTIKINLSSVFQEEGRGKKGGKKGGMMMMGAFAMAGMMAQLIMGKIAMMAGAALMISKMALLLSTIVGLKKLVGSSGGSDSHVVYTSSGGGDHGGGGGGGWHRSLADEDAAVLAYRAYSQNKNGI